MSRATHPLAWWGWALGLAVATTMVTDALVLLALAAAVVAVVVRNRQGSPYARLLPAYLVLAGTIVILRIGFYVVLGIKVPGPVLLDLPSVTLPAWAAGVQLLGPVTTTGLLGAAEGGIRLGVLVLCFGAANALADPRRALRCLPGSMHHLGTAVVIAVSVTPQLVTAAADVRRAQRLRGMRPRSLRSGVTPVLADAVDRSLALASSMDVRGYARTLPGRSDSRVVVLLLAALLGAGLGAYGLLGGVSTPITVVALLGGVGSAVVASWLAGRQVRRTRYRPDPWRTPESITIASGAGVAAVAVVLVQAGSGAGPAAAAVVALVALVPAMGLRRVA